MYSTSFVGDAGFRTGFGKNGDTQTSASRTYSKASSLGNCPTNTTAAEHVESARLIDQQLFVARIVAAPDQVQLRVRYLLAHLGEYADEKVQAAHVREACRGRGNNDLLRG